MTFSLRTISNFEHCVISIVVISKGAVFVGPICMFKEIGKGKVNLLFHMKRKSFPTPKKNPILVKGGGVGFCTVT